MTDDQFAFLLKRAGGMWRVEINKATAAAWWSHLEPFEFNDALDALNQIGATAERMPQNLLPQWLATIRGIEAASAKPQARQQAMPEGTADPRRPYTRAWRHLMAAWEVLQSGRMTGWKGEDVTAKPAWEAKYQLVMREIEALRNLSKALLPEPTTAEPDPPAPAALVAAAVAAEERVREALFDPVPK